jgi:hypothetical protein
VVVGGVVVVVVVVGVDPFLRSRVFLVKDHPD